MKDSKKDIKKNINSEEPVGDQRIPLRHEMEVKDLVNPITISRMRIIQFSILGLILLAGGIYYYAYYMKQPSGLELVNNWIDASGGMEAWQNIKTGSFEREHILYSENGEILKQKTENFFFEKINGDFKLLTNYTTPEGTNVWMGNDEVGYWALRNSLPADPKEAANDLGFMCDSKWCKPDCAMRMTLYRLGMPFNLIGDGVLPNLAGTTEINGMKSNILDVTYRPTVGNDRWVFYADENTNLINKIEYHHKNDHGHSFPEEMYWSDYKEIDGITIPHAWTRYWTNGQILEEYRFKDFQWNEALPVEFASRPEGFDWTIEG